jgi:hypothetical protein
MLLKHRSRRLTFSTFLSDSAEKGLMTERASTTLPGTVEEIISPSDPNEPEKAQIAVQGADELPVEIRIDNTLTTKNGDEVSLRKGATVKVTIKA